MLLVLLVLLVVERAFWVVVELLDDFRWVLDGRERLVVGIVLFTNREKCESSETTKHANKRNTPYPQHFFRFPPS